MKTFVKEELDKYRPNERRFQVTFDHPDILSEESEDREITKYFIRKFSDNDAKKNNTRAWIDRLSLKFCSEMRANCELTCECE